MKKIILIFVLSFLFTPQIFAQYEVGHRSMTVNDATRNRNISLHAYYPAATAGNNVPIVAGEFPLIVFGHGFSIAWSEYQVWWDSLAVKGYILAFPTTESGGLFDSSNHPNFAADLSSLVDIFQAMDADASSDFFQSFNGKSAIMGHSMGGGCTWTAALNPNVTTIVTLAAVETNTVSAIGNAALMTIPTLTLSGDQDCVANSGMSNGGPLDIYNNHAVDPYHAYIDIYGGSHCQFGISSGGSICTLGELCSGFMSKADQHIQMTNAALPWLDYFLKDECQAWLDFRDHAVNGDGVLHDFIERGNLPNTAVLAAKVILEGPYDGTLMTDDLRVGNLVPNTEPFSNLGFSFVNFAGEQAASSVFIPTGNDAVVDWVLVELRDKDDASVVVATKGGFLQRDGDLVDLDGVSPLAIFCVEADDYFVAIKSRNHLGIMTANPVSLSATATSLDFTLASTMVMGGADARKDENGVQLMWTGDTDVSNNCDASDRSNTWNDRNQMGYLLSDLNLDGVCDASDRSDAWNNRNKSSFIP